MKATGIVRRVEECVIIGQTARNPHKHKVFHWFALLNTSPYSYGFSAIFRKEDLFLRTCVRNTYSEQPKLNIQTVAKTG